MHTPTTYETPYHLFQLDSGGRWVLLDCRFQTLDGARYAASQLVRSASDHGVARSIRICRVRFIGIVETAAAS